jgi:hypothetical protein
MVPEAPESESATAALSLPEKIEPADLEALNQAIGALFVLLRHARDLSLGEPHGRQGAVVALHAVWGFLTRFEPVRSESLHVPLMSLHGALLALDGNYTEPILKPTKRTGRATSSPMRQAVIGIAVGTAQQLEWTGLSPHDANAAVAKKLSALGFKPARGKNSVTTGDTVRRWREKINETRPLLRALSQLNLSDISAEDMGWLNAVLNADEMLTEEVRTNLAALAPAEARRHILSSLEVGIRQMMIVDPAKPTS